MVTTPQTWTSPVAMGELFLAMYPTKPFGLTSAMAPHDYLRREFINNCTNCGSRLDVYQNHDTVTGRCLYGMGYITSPAIDIVAQVYHQQILPEHVMYWVHAYFSRELFDDHNKLPPPLRDHRAEFGVYCSDAWAGFMRRHRRATQKLRSHVVTDQVVGALSITAMELHHTPLLSDTVKRWMREEDVWA